MPTRSTIKSSDTLMVGEGFRSLPVGSRPGGAEIDAQSKKPDHCLSPAPSGEFLRNGERPQASSALTWGLLGGRIFAQAGWGTLGRRSLAASISASG